MRRLMACLMMVLMSICFFSCALCEDEVPGREVLYFFENYCESCNPEEDFKAYFRSLTGVSLDACDYRAYNTAKSSGQKALSEAAQKYGLQKTSVPMVIVDGIAYYGAGEMDEALVVDALSWGETTDSVIVLLTVPMCESCLRAAKTLKQLPETVILKRGNHELESVVVPQIIDITEQPTLAAALFDAYSVPEEKRIAPSVFYADTCLNGADEIEKRLIAEVALGWAQGGVKLLTEETLPEE